MNIELKLISNESDRELAKNIVENHHSYVPTYKSVGRRIDWLIYIDEELCGMIGIGSSTYPPCKDILRHLGMTKNDYKEQFNSFANNWRFCMMKSVKNAGTGILKRLRKQAPIEWKRKYGDDLKYLITFVGAGHNGRGVSRRQLELHWQDQRASIPQVSLDEMGRWGQDQGEVREANWRERKTYIYKGTLKEKNRNDRLRGRHIGEHRVRRIVY